MVKLKNFCVVIYGPNKGFKEIIKNVAEGDLEILDGGKFLVISSFSTLLDLDDIESIFMSENLSFVIFEMDNKTSRGYMINEVMQTRLFDSFYNKRKGLRTLDIDDEYVEFEDVKPNDEFYLESLVDDLKSSIENEEYEKSTKIVNEIKMLDMEFYEKFVKGKLG